MAATAEQLREQAAAVATVAGAAMAHEMATMAAAAAAVNWGRFANRCTNRNWGGSWCALWGAARHRAVAAAAVASHTEEVAAAMSAIRNHRTVARAAVAAVAAEKLTAEGGGVGCRGHRHHQNHAVHLVAPSRGESWCPIPRSEHLPNGGSVFQSPARRLPGQTGNPLRCGIKP